MDTSEEYKQTLLPLNAVYTASNSVVMPNFLRHFKEETKRNATTTDIPSLPPPPLSLEMPDVFRIALY